MWKPIRTRGAGEAWPRITARPASRRHHHDNPQLRTDVPEATYGDRRGGTGAARGKNRGGGSLQGPVSSGFRFSRGSGGHAEVRDRPPSPAGWRAVGAVTDQFAITRRPGGASTNPG